MRTKLRELIGATAVAIMIGFGTSAITMEVDRVTKPNKVHGAPSEVAKEVITPSANVNKELFVVQSHADEGYLNAVSLAEDTAAPYGYILDDKYDLGDVVEVEYYHDDILSERELTGEELAYVQYEYEAEINAIYDGGYASSYEEGL